MTVIIFPPWEYLWFTFLSSCLIPFLELPEHKWAIVEIQRHPYLVPELNWDVGTVFAVSYDVALLWESKERDYLCNSEGMFFNSCFIYKTSPGMNRNVLWFFKNYYLLSSDCVLSSMLSFIFIISFNVYMTQHDKFFKFENKETAHGSTVRKWKKGWICAQASWLQNLSA